MLLRCLYEIFNSYFLIVSTAVIILFFNFQLNYLIEYTILHTDDNTKCIRTSYYKKH